MTTPSNLLLDTHIIIWWLQGSNKLDPQWRDLIAKNQFQTFISVISLWEIIIKSSIGKLSIPNTYLDTLIQDGFSFLNFNLSHVKKLSTLPYHHRDPFDRALIAQAMADELTLISADPVMRKYGIK